MSLLLPLQLAPAGDFGSSPTASPCCSAPRILSPHPYLSAWIPCPRRSPCSSCAGLHARHGISIPAHSLKAQLQHFNFSMLCGSLRKRAHCFGVVCGGFLYLLEKQVLEKEIVYSGRRELMVLDINNGELTPATRCTVPAFEWARAFSFLLLTWYDF